MIRKKKGKKWEDLFTTIQLVNLMYFVAPKNLLKKSK